MNATLPIYANGLDRWIRRNHKTQREVASATGIHENLMSGYVNGRHIPGPQNLAKLEQYTSGAVTAGSFINPETPPKEVHVGNARMILGDSLVILPQLTEKARLVLTDPPYRITSGGKETGEMGGIFAKENYDNGGELFEIVEWEDMAWPIFNAIGKNGNAIIMTSDRELSSQRQAFEDSGFKFHRTLVWDKVTPLPNRYFMNRAELADFYYKGEARKLNDCGKSNIIRCARDDKTDHKTEKPIRVLSDWIEATTKEGELIIDPFMGSGSTVEAALRLGRPVIAIEKNPVYFEMAVRRVLESVGHAEMFDHPSFRELFNG